MSKFQLVRLEEFVKSFENKFYLTIKEESFLNFIF